MGSRFERALICGLPGLRNEGNNPKASTCLELRDSKMYRPTYSFAARVGENESCLPPMFHPA